MHFHVPPLPEEHERAKEHIDYYQHLEMVDSLVALEHDLILNSKRCHNAGFYREGNASHELGRLAGAAAKDLHATRSF